MKSQTLKNPSANESPTPGGAPTGFNPGRSLNKASNTSKRKMLILVEKTILTPLLLLKIAPKVFLTQNLANKN